MKTGPKLELVDHAFMRSLVGWVAYVLLDPCRFVVSREAGSVSIASQICGMSVWCSAVPSCLP